MRVVMAYSCFAEFDKSKRPFMGRIVSEYSLSRCPGPLDTYFSSLYCSERKLLSRRRVLKLSSRRSVMNFSISI